MVHVPVLKEEVCLEGIELKEGKPHSVVCLFDKAPTDTFWGETVDEDDSNLLHPYSYLVQFGKIEERLCLVPLLQLVGTTIVVENIQAQETI